MRWRRSALVWPDNAYTRADDDWTLVDANGNRQARISHRGVDEGEGDWRWWVYRPGGAVYGGGAMSGPEAKKICEALLEEKPE